MKVLFLQRSPQQTYVASMAVLTQDTFLYPVSSLCFQLEFDQGVDKISFVYFIYITTTYTLRVRNFCVWMAGTFWIMPMKICYYLLNIIVPLNVLCLYPYFRCDLCFQTTRTTEYKLQFYWHRHFISCIALFSTQKECRCKSDYKQSSTPFGITILHLQF